MRNSSGEINTLSREEEEPQDLTPETTILDYHLLMCNLKK